MATRHCTHCNVDIWRQCDLERAKEWLYPSTQKKIVALGQRVQDWTCTSELLALSLHSLVLEATADGISPATLGMLLSMLQHTSGDIECSLLHRCMCLNKLQLVPVILDYGACPHIVNTIKVLPNPSAAFVAPTFDATLALVATNQCLSSVRTIAHASPYVSYVQDSTVGARPPPDRGRCIMRLWRRWHGAQGARSTQTPRRAWAAVVVKTRATAHVLKWYPALRGQALRVLLVPPTLRLGPACGRAGCGCLYGPATVRFLTEVEHTMCQQLWFLVRAATGQRRPAHTAHVQRVVGEALQGAKAPVHPRRAVALLGALHHVSAQMDGDAHSSLWMSLLGLVCRGFLHMGLGCKLVTAGVCAGCVQWVPPSPSSTQGPQGLRFSAVEALSFSQRARPLMGTNGDPYAETFVDALLASEATLLTDTVAAALHRVRFDRRSAVRRKWLRWTGDARKRAWLRMCAASGSRQQRHHRSHGSTLIMGARLLSCMGAPRTPSAADARTAIASILKLHQRTQVSLGSAASTSLPVCIRSGGPPPSPIP